MTPDKSHSDTVGRVANKIRVEGIEDPFNPHYPSSDALPVPEIFLLFPLFYTNDSFNHYSIGTLCRKRSNVHSKRTQVHETMKSFLYLISKLRGITLYINEKWSL